MPRKEMYKQSPTVKVKKSTKTLLEHLDFVRFGMTRNKIIRKLIRYYRKNEKKVPMEK
ncbi:hypothetical protein HOD29_04940 [archaeon]|jgi:hypothetical protein|nr:hypothetical protein [archaeon]